MEPLSASLRQQILNRDPNAVQGIEEYERLLAQRFTQPYPSPPEDEARISELYEKLFGAPDPTIGQEETTPPNPSHKFCEVHQDAILASRGYYRLSGTIMLMIICFQRWHEGGISFWLILPVWFLIWRLHQFAGKRIEEINFTHAQQKWDENHGQTDFDEHEEHE